MIVSESRVARYDLLTELSLLKRNTESCDLELRRQNKQYPSWINEPSRLYAKADYESHTKGLEQN
jgi:hypothetical protein